MSDPGGQPALRVPGRLIKDPTDADLSGTAPFGGTWLGLVRAVMLMTFAPVEPIRRPAFGPAEIADFVELGYRFELRGLVEAWDDDMFSALFLNTAAGATQSRTGITHPGSNLPGSLLSDRAFKLVYLPDDANHPAVYFRSALPVVARPFGSGGAETPLSHNSVATWGVRFVARRDPTTQNGSVQWQVAEDVTL